MQPSMHSHGVQHAHLHYLTEQASCMIDLCLLVAIALLESQDTLILQVHRYHRQ